MTMLRSGICSFVNFKSDVSSSISSLTHDGFKKLMTQKMANIFNEVFVNTAQKISEKIPKTRKSPLDYLSSKNAEAFFISPHEIKVIINSMKSGKAVGPYSIPIFLLKLLREHIAIPLCDIITLFQVQFFLT